MTLSWSCPREDVIAVPFGYRRNSLLGCRELPDTRMEEVAGVSHSREEEPKSQ